MFKEHNVASYLVVFIVACALIAGTYLLISVNTRTVAISSFDECVAAGNVVMESNPPQCAANGQVFIKPQDSIVE